MTRQVVPRTVARCLAEGCPWVPVGQTWAEVDRAAEKHTKQTGHATTANTTYYPVREDT